MTVPIKLINGIGIKIPSSYLDAYALKKYNQLYSKVKTKINQEIFYLSVFYKTAATNEIKTLILSELLKGDEKVEFLKESSMDVLFENSQKKIKFNKMEKNLKHNLIIFHHLFYDESIDLSSKKWFELCLFNILNIVDETIDNQLSIYFFDSYIEIKTNSKFLISFTCENEQSIFKLKKTITTLNKVPLDVYKKDQNSSYTFVFKNHAKDKQQLNIHKHRKHRKYRGKQC